MAEKHRKKILSKYSEMIEKGLIPEPDAQNLVHVDLLVIEKRIKEIERRIKNEEKNKIKDVECTFKPSIISKHSFRDSSKLSSHYISRLSKQTSKALKLSVVIDKGKKELFFLTQKSDILREIQRISEKYGLKERKKEKFRSILEKQWEAFYIQNK